MKNQFYYICIKDSSGNTIEQNYAFYYDRNKKGSDYNSKTAFELARQHLLMRLNKDKF
jgi:hypothetical protein